MMDGSGVRELGKRVLWILRDSSRVMIIGNVITNLVFNHCVSQMKIPWAPRADDFIEERSIV